MFANTAPKLYVGGAVCEASEKEWVTWNNGETERFFARSALAPSKKKLVRWVAKIGYSVASYTEFQREKDA